MVHGVVRPKLTSPLLGTTLMAEICYISPYTDFMHFDYIQYFAGWLAACRAETEVLTE